MKCVVVAVLAMSGTFSFAGGNVESLTTAYDISLSGWACDPVSPDAQISVEVFRDNVFIGTLKADKAREPGVAAACGSNHSSHGFSGTLKVPVHMLTGGSSQVSVNGRRYGGELGSVFPLGGSPQVKTFASDSGSSQSPFLFQQGLNPLYDVQAARWDSSWGTNNIPPLSLFTLALGDVSSTPSWNVSSKTGLTNANGQLAVLSAQESSAIQVKGDQVGVFVHTATAPPFGNEKKKVLNFTKKWAEGAPYPWNGQYGENASLCTGFNAAVPVSTKSGDANGFTSTAFQLWDLKSTGAKKYFVYEIVYFQSGNEPTEYLRYDETMGVPHALSFAGGSTRWSTLGGGSNEVQRNTWNNDLYFSYCVSKQQMDDVVARINEKFNMDFSTERLGVELALLGAEVSTGDTGMFGGTLGARYGQWYVRMLK